MLFNVKCCKFDSKVICSEMLMAFNSSLVCACNQNNPKRLAMFTKIYQTGQAFMTPDGRLKGCASVLL